MITVMEDGAAASGRSGFAHRHCRADTRRVGTLRVDASSLVHSVLVCGGGCYYLYYHSDSRNGTNDGTVVVVVVVVVTPIHHVVRYRGHPDARGGQRRD
jgi:hypothetical protein